MLLDAKAKGLLTTIGEAFKESLIAFRGWAQRVRAATAKDRFELTKDFVTTVGFVVATHAEHLLYEGLSNDVSGYIAAFLIKMTLLAWPTLRLLKRLQPIVRIVKGFFRD